MTLLRLSNLTTVYCKYWFIGRRCLSSNEFTKTLNLPCTSFPLSMKGNVTPQREIEIQKKSNFDNLYQWQSNDSSRKQTFVLHDGPPYANGDPHVGHALNKVMKDITNRYKLLQGYRVHYVPGWDCHGTPIEQKALAEIRSDHRVMTPIDIRSRANTFAHKAADKQLAAFRRWGVMADWKTGCYYTFDKIYEVAQLETFYKMYEKGLIYQDYMPVQWSPSSGTALAEAEIEYNESYESTAVYVKYKFDQLSAGVAAMVPHAADLYALIWTTTPWTLPMNQAICFGSNIDYCLVKGHSRSYFIVAAVFYEKLSQILGGQLTLMNTFQGSLLGGCTYVSEAWNDRPLPLLPASHVTTAKGTGLVHTAPAHGAEDFQIALKYNLPMIYSAPDNLSSTLGHYPLFMTAVGIKDCFVDEDGKYMHGISDTLVGKSVLQEGNKLVLDIMSNQVVHLEPFKHSYPLDWRTKQPLITRASRQWFVNTSQLRDSALNCLKDVRIYPSASNTGMLAQLERRTYWCISRQRVWGMPVPVFYESQSRKPLISRASIDHLKELVAKKGSDCWWSMSLKDLLPDSVITASGHDACLKYEQGKDVLDIWFDSGVSWASVLADCNHMADVYLEGVDQFGGWFQSSLLTSVAVQNKAPYRSLVVHGFALDEDGKKMSKSLGNVIDPDVVINGGKDKKINPAYGVDVLRLWVAHSGTDPRVHIGPSLLHAANERLFKMRKSLRYLMSNLDDFNPNEHAMAYEDLRLVDQYTLHLLCEFINQVTEAYEEFNYSRVVNNVDKFVATSVSAFHAHITKDRVYCCHKNSIDRRSAQTVQYLLLAAIVRIIAPIVPHLAEEVHQYHPLQSCGDSVFKLRWFVPESSWNNTQVAATVSLALQIRDAFYNCIASQRPGDFDVVVQCSSDLYKHLKILQADSSSSYSELCELLQSASVTLLDESQTTSATQPSTTKSCETAGVGDLQLDDGSCVSSSFSLRVQVAAHGQCPRCWRRVSIKTNHLCDRCQLAVS